MERDGEAELELSEPFNGFSFGELVGIAVVSAVLFGVGLLVTESVGELGLDVDFKPFFVPYLLVAAVPFGLRTVSISLGAALGEGVLDVLEGYELDDPLGFVGYVVGFTVFGLVLHRTNLDASSSRVQLGAAMLAAFVQALFEGLAFYLFENPAALGAAVSVLGNTLTHGVVLGWLPFLVLARYLEDRLAIAT